MERYEAYQPPKKKGFYLDPRTKVLFMAFIVAETILGVIQNKKQEVEKYRICKRENDQKSSLD